MAHLPPVLMLYRRLGLHWSLTIRKHCYVSVTMLIGVLRALGLSCALTGYILRVSKHTYRDPYDDILPVFPRRIHTSNHDPGVQGLYKSYTVPVEPYYPGILPPADVPATSTLIILRFLTKPKHAGENHALQFQGK